MSIGGGKGGSTQQTTSPAATKLAGIAEHFATQSDPARQGLLDAMQEVLQTGGSTIPIISAATERSRQEASKAATTTEESLAQQDLVGTPFGEMIKATVGQQGAQAVAGTQQSMANNIFEMISNFVLGQGQTALSGLAGAIPGMNRVKGTEFAVAAGAGGK